MPKSRVVLSAALLVMGMSFLPAGHLCPPVEAALIVFEPDTYAVGTNVSNVVEGVTINRFSEGYQYSIGDPSGYTYGTPTISPVYVTDGAYADRPVPTGTRTFGNYFSIDEAQRDWESIMNTGLPYPSPVQGNETYSAMVIQLDSPTNFFEIAYVHNIDPIQLFAYDSSNTLVAYTRPWGTGLNTTDILWQEVTPPSCCSDRVGVLQVGSLGADQSPFFQTILVGGWSTTTTLDRIRVSVPEPSAMALLGMGLAGLVGFGRRRFKK